MTDDPYSRLLNAGIRCDCAAEIVAYYRTHKTESELETYIRNFENREVSDR